MGKVLLIHKDFPGRGDRNVKMIYHLSRQGHEVHIVTNRSPLSRRPSSFHGTFDGNVHIHETFCINKSPFRVFSRLLSSRRTADFLDKLFFVPDFFVTWLPFALINGIRIIRRERIDVIMTTSPPESLHLAGMLLSWLTGIPWLTEFQDLWSTKKIVNSAATPFHEMLVRRMEKAVYGRADHIVANTSINREIYTRDFSLPADKITVITCGFDPDELNDREGTTPQKDKFTIGYMGYFDKPGFPWKRFLYAFKDVMDMADSNSMEVNVCGFVSDEARKFIVREGLERNVVLHGLLSHDEAVRRTRRNHLLLALHYETGYSRAIVPHKLYHYLAMGSPILAVGDEDGEMAQILRSTKAGRAVSLKRDGEPRNALWTYYREWKETGVLGYQPNREEIMRYDFSKLAKRLSGAIEQCLSLNGRERRGAQCF